MSREAFAHLLKLGLLVACVLVVSACGGGGGGGEQQQAEARPLPEVKQALRPGTYSSEEFKPSLSFSVGEGWAYEGLETSDFLLLSRGEEETFTFINAQEIYKPTKTGTPTVVDAPKDLVGWFQQHPRLQTDKPEPVTVGGVEGVRVDVVVEDLPEDYFGVCGSDCVDVFRISGADYWAFVEQWKERVIVLEDVKGETVTIDFGSPAAEFDEFLPKAEKVLDSVEWEGE